MRTTRLMPALLIVLGVAACSDQASTPQPDTGPDARPASPTELPQARLDRLERLARRTARALRDPAFREDVRQAIAASPYREGKVHFQRYLRSDGGRRLRLVASENVESESDLDTDITRSGSLEMYFPVPEHRRAWQGGTDLLVATANSDGEAPVAFDLNGRRIVLDPKQPPAVPVLAVEPAELDFEASRLALATCGDWCDPSGPTPPPVTPGLYMSKLEFVQDFEGWLKGDPEYEIHILGPATKGDNQNLASVQCVGGNAVSPYRWDMNSKTWTGNQLLFTRAQMDAFDKAYPGKPFTVFAIEDDDTGCQIKTDSDRAGKLLKALSQAFADWKSAQGQKITPDGAGRILKAAQSGFALLTALYSVITTADDIIGVAISDEVSGRYRTGTNWTFMNDQVQPNGYIQMQIRN